MCDFRVRVRFVFLIYRILSSGGMAEGEYWGGTQYARLIESFVSSAKQKSKEWTASVRSTPDLEIALFEN